MAPNGETGFQEGSTYNVSVTSVTDTESAAKGTPLLLFKFEVTEGEMQGEELEYEMYATPGRRDATMRELQILGFDAESPTADWGGLKEFLIGRECSVSLVSDTWNGKTRLKVRGLRAKSSVNEPGGVLGRIAALFGGVVRTSEEKKKHEGVPF